MDEFDQFRSSLDDLHAAGRRLRLWLRDDDAAEPTPALERLLSAMNRHGVPGLLAVIPAQCTRALAERLTDETLVQVATHGWAHENHQPPGTKTSEFGADRPLADSLADLTRGQERIGTVFGDTALPIFVPPWNRIGPKVVRALPEARFSALSVFGPRGSGPVPEINAHVDLIDWRGTRGGRPAPELLDEVRGWAETDEPAIGLLTHHLVHDRAAWAFVDRFFEVTSVHPAVEWVSPAALLAGATSGT